MAEIIPGTYIGEGPYGTLKITKHKKKFDLELSEFDERGGCQLKTTFDAFGKIIAPGSDPKEDACYFSLTEVAGKLQFKPMIETCYNSNYFCGAHSSFVTDIFSFPVPSYCSIDDVAKARSVFLKFYKKKDYVNAKKTLKPITDSCQKYIFDFNHVLNDMAVTYYHLKEKENCLKILEPLKELMNQTNEQIEENENLTFIIEDNIKLRDKTKKNFELCEKLL